MTLEASPGTFQRDRYKLLDAHIAS